MPDVLTFDGKNIKSISAAAGRNDAYYTNIDDAATGDRIDVVGGLKASTAFQLVPWVNRAVDMVASSVSTMPFDLLNKAGVDVKDDAANAELLKSFTKHLYMVVGSLWLSAAAYLVYESNGVGRNVTLKFVRARFMTPKVVGGELVGFNYRDTSGQVPPRFYALEEVIYFWLPNFDSDVRPGPAPVVVALGAASVLLAITQLEAGFFNSGGVKITVFEVPGSTSETEKANFQNFLNRQLSSVRNAFRNIAVRFGVKPTVIGSDPKEMAAPELTASERDNVAVGLRVPPSVISGKVSDVMNSRADKAFFYDNTVIPVFRFIAEVLNEQLFKTKLKEPLTLKPAPERLPIMQEIMLDTGKALSLLSGGKAIFKVDESRNVLGLGKWSEGDPDSAPAAPAPVINQVAPAAPPDTQPAALADGDKPAPKGQPAAKAVASEQFETMVGAIVEWRKLMVDGVRHGMHPAGIAAPDGVPDTVRKAIGHDLLNIVNPSASDVRAIVGRYFPVKTQAPDDPAAALLEQGRRIEAAIERATAELAK